MSSGTKRYVLWSSSGTAANSPAQDSEAFEREYTAATVTVEAPAASKAKKGKKVAEEEDEDEEFTTVGKGGKTIQFTPEGIFKNLQAIQEARGKKVSFDAFV